MHTSGPEMPTPAPTYNFAWMSQYPYPIHHESMSSVGQIMGLAKLKKFITMNQPARQEAGKLPLRECQTRGGRQTRRESMARTLRTPWAETSMNGGG